MPSLPGFFIGLWGLSRFSSVSGSLCISPPQQKYQCHSLYGVVFLTSGWIGLGLLTGVAERRYVLRGECLLWKRGVFRCNLRRGISDRTQRKRPETGQGQILEERVGQSIQDPKDHDQSGTSATHFISQKI